MIIMAFDSTAKAASVAISDNEQLLALYNIDNGLTQSELLLPMAENMLNSLHLSFDDVDAFTCSVGPGSFTGVRIGTALVKGLAFGKNLPCIEVSTIEALAYNCLGMDGLIVPVMDARRGQVYTALFESKDGVITRLCDDQALSLEALSEILTDYNGKSIYLVGDGYQITKAFLASKGIETKTTPPLLIAENAYSCARVAYIKHQSGQYKSDTEFAPTYLRLPQAERERLEKLQNSKQ